MKFIDRGNSILLWLSANDTWKWAHKTNAIWPCSQLEGKRLFAAFDTNGLYELTIDGKGPYEDEVNIDEFNAITADFIEARIKPDHPCYFVTVGQFRSNNANNNH